MGFLLEGNLCGVQDWRKASTPVRFRDRVHSAFVADPPAAVGWFVIERGLGA